MTFTDDDLKRLKDLNKQEMERTILSLYTNSDIAALLARLEAAENCAELTWFHFGSERDDFKYPTPMARELGESTNAWRKEAGK